jgi:tRNA-dihydrouridine synthase B
MQHYRVMLQELGEARAVPQMRKHLGYYFKGFPGASELRERVMRTETAKSTLAEAERMIERLEQEEEARSAA